MGFHVAGLHHVNLEVTDVERARGFYLRLGLREIPRAGEPNRPGAWFELDDDRQLHLSAGSPVRGGWHLALLVDDLIAARRAVSGIPAPIEEGRELPGYVRFFTRDPDGNRIEILQPVRHPAAG